MSMPAERAQRPRKPETSPSETAQESQEKLCSKCGVQPATLKHDWCKACKAEYQREYTGTVVDVAERRGFQKGAEAMRQHLVAEFLKAPPTGLMRAGEIASFIAGTPPPQRADS